MEEGWVNSLLGQIRKQNGYVNNSVCLGYLWIFDKHVSACVSGCKNCWKYRFVTNSCSVRRWRELPTKVIFIQTTALAANLGGESDKGDLPIMSLSRCDTARIKPFRICKDGPWIVTVYDTWHSSDSFVLGRVSKWKHVAATSPLRKLREACWLLAWRKQARKTFSFTAQGNTFLIQTLRCQIYCTTWHPET